MDLKNLNPEDALTAVASTDDLNDLRDMAKSMGISYSGNSSAGTIKNKLVEALRLMIADENPDTGDSSLDGESLPDLESDDAPAVAMGGAGSIFDGGSGEHVQVYKPKGKTKGNVPLSDHDLINMDPTKIEDPALRRRAVRARALRLIRVKVTNLNPGDAPLSAMIITANNKYTGKVSRLVPFGDNDGNGWHVEKILLDHMRQMKFPLRKEKKGNRTGVKQYTTIMSPKFSIEELPPLTPEQIKELAARQRAAGSIDRSSAI